MTHLYIIETGDEEGHSQIVARITDKAKAYRTVLEYDLSKYNWISLTTHKLYGDTFEKESYTADDPDFLFYYRFNDRDNVIEIQGTLPTDEVEAAQNLDGLHEAKRLLTHVDKLSDDQIEQLRLLNDEIDTPEDEDDDEGDLDYDDPMDGDHASALASAGMGTDEDYGCFGDDFF